MGEAGREGGGGERVLAENGLARYMRFLASFCPSPLIQGDPKPQCQAASG